MTYPLPPLHLEDDWPSRRREWVAVAEDCLYGHAPRAGKVWGEVMNREPLWEGRAVRETVRVHFGRGPGHAFTATLIVPSGEGPFPAITWNQFATDRFDHCPYERVAARGYLLAGFNREQIVRDHPLGCAKARLLYPGYDWGAVRIWAWAQSRLADYLLTRPDVDPARLVCTGFSRGGKVALAAGVFDERFAVCAAVGSGAGGAGCFRYLGDRTGYTQDWLHTETLGRVGSRFYYWWTRRLARWRSKLHPRRMGREQSFPLDSHVLKALIAPRHLLCCEAMDDAWSNPWGTALTWRAAQPAFDALGGRSALHYRPGGHDFLEEDWRVILDFCDETLLGRPSGRDWRAGEPPRAWLDDMTN